MLHKGLQEIGLSLFVEKPVSMNTCSGLSRQSPFVAMNRTTAEPESSIDSFMVDSMKLIMQNKENV